MKFPPEERYPRLVASGRLLVHHLDPRHVALCHHLPQEGGWYSDLETETPDGTGATRGELWGPFETQEAAYAEALARFVLQAGDDKTVLLAHAGATREEHVPVASLSPHVHIEPNEGHWTLAEFVVLKVVYEQPFPTLGEALSVAIQRGYPQFIAVF